MKAADGGKVRPQIIYVTKPVLPSFFEYVVAVRKIWESHTLTNNGPAQLRFVEQLKRFVGTENLAVVANGTLALELALRALDLLPGGEVITTNYSFVATANSIINCGLKPVLVDISPTSYNIDPEMIEQAITEHTVAILPVHVYGLPASYEAIDDIGRRYNLPVVYDAAHCFGVTINGKSILTVGDYSTCSFHATKVFNSAEGGCITSHHGVEMIEKLRNFGFCAENDVSLIGTNAKVSEFSCVLGSLNLRTFRDATEKRRRIFERYQKNLDPRLIPTEVSDIHNDKNIYWNYSYMPICFNHLGREASRNKVYQVLSERLIFARKYFYPLISDMTAYQTRKRLWRMQGNCNNSRAAAESTLCLPIYPGLEMRDVDRISEIVNREITTSI